MRNLGDVFCNKARFAARGNRFPTRVIEHKVNGRRVADCTTEIEAPRFWPASRSHSWNDRSAKLDLEGPRTRRAFDRPRTPWTEPEAHSAARKWNHDTRTAGSIDNACKRSARSGRLPLTSFKPSNQPVVPGVDHERSRSRVTQPANDLAWTRENLPRLVIE